MILHHLHSLHPRSALACMVQPAGAKHAAQPGSRTCMSTALECSAQRLHGLVC